MYHRELKQSYISLNDMLYRPVSHPHMKCIVSVQCALWMRSRHWSNVTSYVMVVRYLSNNILWLKANHRWKWKLVWTLNINVPIVCLGCWQTPRSRGSMLVPIVCLGCWQTPRSRGSMLVPIVCLGCWQTPRSRGSMLDFWSLVRFEPTRAC